MATRNTGKSSGSSGSDRNFSNSRDSSFKPDKKVGSSSSSSSRDASSTSSRKGTSNLNSSRKSGSGIMEDDEDL
ncbi:hypothetical protein [Bdellovibrio sp. HCB209]|uniref:hypothetical protein n=1 Tax=Bdellovibrio sp. HCB209 TaxID=3394354 RepID=UPI0039B6252E